MDHPRDRRELTIASICGLVAALAGALAQWASHRPSFHPSLLLDVAERDPLAQLIRGLDPSFRFSTSNEHYDGGYFYAMAIDPLATGQAHDVIDLAAYRYGHPFYSWVAMVLSGGQAKALPVVFMLMSLASMAAAGFLVSRLVARLGGSPWWGLVVAASPGLLFSSSTALTEPFQVALVCLALLAWSADRRRPVLLGLMLIAICLTKEQLALLPVAMGLAWLAHTLRHRDEFTWRAALTDVLPLAAGPVALVGWLAFIRTHFTSEQLHYDSDNIGLPFAHMPEIFRLTGMLRTGDMYASQIGTTSPSGIIAIGVVLAAGAVVGLRRRDALGCLAALQALLVSGLGWRTLMYPHEQFRIASVPLVIAVLSLAVSLGRGHRSPSLGLSSESCRVDDTEQSDAQRA